MSATRLPKHPRSQIGDRATWPEHFKNNRYYTACVVSKIFHMGVPRGIESGDHGADDERTWTDRFNSPGPEWKAPGDGETHENNADGKKPAVGEHDLWAKASLTDEPASVPLIICVPGKRPAVRDRLVELLDLHPAKSALRGLEVRDRLRR